MILPTYDVISKSEHEKERLLFLRATIRHSSSPIAILAQTASSVCLPFRSSVQEKSRRHSCPLSHRLSVRRPDSDSTRSHGRVQTGCIRLFCSHSRNLFSGMLSCSGISKDEWTGRDEHCGSNLADEEEEEEEEEEDQPAIHP